MLKDLDIKYILPGFLNYGINEVILEIYDKYPEITRENTSIYSFFGCFPQAIWNGGRPDFNNSKFTRKHMKKIAKFYYSRGIVIALTFTNPLIKEEHLGDEYCNDILEIFYNDLNEILVNSPILEEYIRKNYPLYKINRSITATENDPCKMDNYYITVIKKDLNRNFHFLTKIKEKDKIEILCNELCINDCPYTYTHYNEIGNLMLGYRPNEVEKKNFYGTCRWQDKDKEFETFYWQHHFSKYYISPDDIARVYAPMGFKYFKIAGREKFSGMGLIQIIDYCIKPEYQSDVRTYMMERELVEYEKYLIESIEY